MDAVKSRLVEFLKYKGLDKSVFERMCGLANGFVDKTNSRMRKTSLNSISTTFPELNTEWLMSGKGEMIIDVDVKPEQETSEVMALLQRIDKLIEIHERDVAVHEQNAKNVDRLLSLLLERSVSSEPEQTKEKAVG
ncbi:MAG: hypothetical protein IJ064_05860 [Bacteroidaceae bacterium]|nr:hypothetical protein [Bacteroidaceae bacterium]